MTKKRGIRDTQPVKLPGPVPPKNRPLVRRYCTYCGAMLGYKITEVPGLGPLCESCAEVQAESAYKKEQQDRRWFRSWVLSLWGRLW